LITHVKVDIEKDLDLANHYIDAVAAKVAAEGAEVRVLVRRIGEEMQKDEAVMAALRRVGALPDKVVTVGAGAEGVLIGSGGETAEIDTEFASHLFVRRL
ncbi:MAG: hypothetical protein ACXVW8_13025, partial [Nocardioidaceae bacterium]